MFRKLTPASWLAPTLAVTLAAVVAGGCGTHGTDADDRTTSVAAQTPDTVTKSQFEYLESTFFGYDSLTRKTTIPDWYGGYYTDYQDGPVILLTDMSVKERLIAAGMTGTEFKQCDYSFNQLKSLVDKINAARRVKGSWAAKNIALVSINTEKNRVVAYVKTPGRTTEREFAEHVISSPAIICEEHVNQ